VDVTDIKDFRNVQTSPMKKGLGGYVASKGVLLSPFPVLTFLWTQIEVGCMRRHGVRICLDAASVVWEGTAI